VASAYILLGPPHRRAMLLHRAEQHIGYVSIYPHSIAEPVTRFEHSTRAPLVVFASFENGALTHIADGRKGASAGTDLVRLNMEDLVPLQRSVPFTTLEAKVAARFRQHLRRAFEQGGLLPPKTLGAVVDALSRLDPSIAPRLARFSERRKERIRRLSPKARDNLALQKESLTVALEITGLSKKEILSWAPGETPPQTFLDGMPQAYVREDAMLVADFSNLPGFSAINDAAHYAARTFESKTDSTKRLTVFMANKLALEEQTGADLIYYNEAYRSFVLVQYKAMEKGEQNAEFRWKDGDQLTAELARMDKTLAELAKIPPDDDPDGYRLTANPFLLKFCSRVTFNPDDKGLFPGMYIPLDLWKGLHASGRLKGPRGGNVLTYENVGRRLNNTEFVTLMANAWIGTTIGQSAVLEKVIETVLETGKTVTFAIKRKPRDARGHATSYIETPLTGKAADIPLHHVIEGS
jgi:hypothetical protein